MNFPVYVLSIFGSICKKVVKNSDCGEGDWVAGDRGKLFTVYPFMLFTLYANECITFSKKGERERKPNLRRASALDTQLAGSTSFAGWSKFCEVGMFWGRSFAKIFSEKVSNVDFKRTRDIIIQMTLPFR